METKYYDIGLNLFCRQFKDPIKVVEDAAAEGVKCILTGTDPKENRLVNDFVKTHGCFGTAGIHPHNADRAAEHDFKNIENYVSNNEKIVAVGECGLDFDRMFSAKENQINCLKKHIEIAEKTNKPLFLHERDAAEAFVQCFKEHKDICKKSVVHCFTGNKAVLERYLDMGFYIGITGWICDERRADELREAVKILPLDKVMLETDAPYLIPRNIKGLGRMNVPQNIKYVAAELARYMGVNEDELRENALINTKKVFGLS